MRNFYTSIPDLSWVYPASEKYGYDKAPHQYEQINPSNCRFFKEVRLFVTSENRILSIDDICSHLNLEGNIWFVGIQQTIKFYEQSGLISYVPNYDGDELLFTNTKHFKKLWNG